jgi:hypothetical protein
MAKSDFQSQSADAHSAQLTRPFHTLPLSLTISPSLPCAFYDFPMLPLAYTSFRIANCTSGSSRDSRNMSGLPPSFSSIPSRLCTAQTQYSADRLRFRLRKRVVTLPLGWHRLPTRWNRPFRSETPSQSLRLVSHSFYTCLTFPFSYSSLYSTRIRASSSPFPSHSYQATISPDDRSASRQTLGTSILDSPSRSRSHHAVSCWKYGVGVGLGRRRHRVS